MTKYRSLVLVLFVVTAAVSLAVVSAQSGGDTANIEVRVWEATGDAERNYISARPEGGSWRTLGTIPLNMDQENERGTFRYADITVAVPLPDPVPDLGPPSPRARLVDITCTYHRSEWGDASAPNASWQVEGTFLHRLPYTFTPHVGVQPQRPHDVPAGVDSQVWDELAVGVGELHYSEERGAYREEVSVGAQVTWSVSIGAGPMTPGNYYADFPRVYVVSVYAGDPINRRVALDPAVECLRTADVRR